MISKILYIVAVIFIVYSPAQLIFAQPAGAQTVLYIDRFSTEPVIADDKSKAKRVESIPESKLLEIQEAIQSETKKSGLFSEVRILKEGQKPVLEEGQEVWVLGGNFIDYKKGSQTARAMIGYGAGKQKLEVQVEIKNARTGETIRTERVVDRKVGGYAGGSNEKGLKDFAERIVALLKEVKNPPAK